MIIKMIAAVGQDWELGKDNKLIWAIPEDLKFFKETTQGHKVVMGRKTFESIGRPLPDRESIVLSSKGMNNDKVKVINNISELLNITKQDEVVYIIGGESIYKQFLPYANELILTHIEECDFKADTYFPHIEHNDYEILCLGRYRYNDLNYLRKIYKAKKQKQLEV